MQKITLLAMASLGLFTVANAQQKQGTITYEAKRNMWKMLPNEEMKQFVPEFRTAKYVLSFTDSTSLYKNLPEEEMPETFSNGGTNFQFRVGGPGAGEGETFRNYSNQTVLQQTEFMGKVFLITDSIKKQPWKITNETKDILGHTCRKAVMKTEAPVMRRTSVTTSRSLSEAVTGSTDTTIQNSKPREMEVVAWFAQDIVAPVGPDNYTQLPGAILQVDIDNGLNIITAVDIKNTVDTKEIKEPKKGKKVTRKEYNETIQEFFKNNNGPVIIRQGGPL